MAIDQPVFLRNVASAFLAVSWVTVTLRVYVRTLMVKAFGADDWLAVLSLFVLTLHCAFVIVGTEYLESSSNSEIAILNAIEALKWWYAASIPYIVGTALIKATVGVFLLRFCGKLWQKWTIYIVLSIVVLYDIAYLLIVVFQCLPVGHFWLQYTGQKGTCISRVILTRLSYTASTINAVGDLILGTLPVFLVMNLQINYRTKISIACILGLGSISCISTVVRLPYLVTLLTTTDFLTATTPIGIIGIIELGLGLTAASMVTLKPLFNAWFTEREAWYARTKESRSNIYPGDHIRSHNDFVELEERKPRMARKTTESEEVLGLDDFESEESGTRYGHLRKGSSGGMTVTITSAR